MIFACNQPAPAARSLGRQPGHRPAGAPFAAKEAALNRRPLFALPFCLLLACQAEQTTTMALNFDPCTPLTLVPEAGATSAELLSIDDAVAMWHAAGVSHLSRLDGPGAQHVPVRFQQAAPNFFGLYADHTGEIYVNTLLTDRKQRAITVAHELGHAWGLWHVDPVSRISVMNKDNLKIAPLSTDAHAVLEHWGGTCAARGIVD